MLIIRYNTVEKYFLHYFIHAHIISMYILGGGHTYYRP
jgi:hypothetical protein